MRILMPDLSRWWMRVGGDVLPGRRAGADPGGRVLDIPEPVQGFAGNPEQDSIAVVKAEGEGVSEFLWQGVGE